TPTSMAASNASPWVRYRRLRVHMRRRGSSSGRRGASARRRGMGRSGGPALVNVAVKHHRVPVLDLQHGGITGDQRGAAVKQGTLGGTVDLFDDGAARAVSGEDEAAVRLDDEAAVTGRGTG